MFENREFAEVWCKGGESFEELDEVDQQRLILFERRPIMWWHHGFQLRQQGLVPDADWRSIQRAIQEFGRRRAVREAWLVFKEDFDAEFKSLMEKQFELADH